MGFKSKAHSQCFHYLILKANNIKSTQENIKSVQSFTQIFHLHNIQYSSRQKKQFDIALINRLPYFQKSGGA